METKSDMVSARAADGQDFPNPVYAWYVVGLLTLIYIFSYIDRQVLGLLVGPIKADMGLTDTQIGLLMGPAFAVFYATMGIPLGWLADRRSRRTIIAVGVALWSVATAASGLARSFGALFAARISVGVGEATLSPCALSMIADMFPKYLRARAIAVYSTALSVGAGTGYLIVAAVLDFADSLDLSALAAYGIEKPWHLTFVMLGLPGVLLALLMALVREPARRDAGSMGGAGGPGFRETFAYLGARWLPFVSVALIVSVMTVTAYTSFWYPALFERTWGWEASFFSRINGVALLILGPVSVNLAGWLADRYSMRKIADGAFRIMAVGLFVMVPSAALFPLLPTGMNAFVTSQVTTIGIAMVSSVGVPALFAICPGEIRGRVTALYYMFISMAGLFIGPPGVALLTDSVFADEGMIRYSMALVPALYGLPVLLLLPVLRRAYTREVDRFEAALAETD